MCGKNHGISVHLYLPLFFICSFFLSVFFSPYRSFAISPILEDTDAPSAVSVPPDVLLVPMALASLELVLGWGPARIQSYCDDVFGETIEDARKLGFSVEPRSGRGAHIFGLRVPPGTQSGQRFRLRERGMPSLRGESRGDLIVEVHLRLPAILDERSKELLREFGRLNGEGERALPATPVTEVRPIIVGAPAGAPTGSAAQAPDDPA